MMGEKYCFKMEIYGDGALNVSVMSKGRERAGNALARAGAAAPHLDAVGLLDGEHLAVLLGSCDGHGFFLILLTTHHWYMKGLNEGFTARLASLLSARAFCLDHGLLCLSVCDSSCRITIAN